MLGEAWAAQRLEVDVVITGSLRRHAQTEAEVAAAYARAGLAWPSASVRANWNEYDAVTIMRVLGDALRAREPTFARLVDEFQAALESPDRNRYFQRMFEVLMTRWVGGDLLADEVESFATFHERVVQGLAQVVGEGGRNVAVFTSGGPIGVCVQQALQAPKAQAVELNWRVRNASVSELMFARSGRLSLDTFNGTPHLTDPKLVSFR